MADYYGFSESFMKAQRAYDAMEPPDYWEEEEDECPECGGEWEMRRQGLSDIYYCKECRYEKD